MAFPSLKKDTSAFKEDASYDDIDRSLDSDEIKRTKEDAERDALDGETNLKRELAMKTFRFMEAFVCFIGVFLTYYICYFAWFRLEIPKEIIIALITTTLASIVGLVGFILKGLFSGK